MHVQVFTNTLYGFLGIAVVKIGIPEGLQKVVLHRQAAQYGVGQGDAIARVHIAEGRTVLLGIHGDAGQHFFNVDLHKADNQRLALKGMWTDTPMMTFLSSLSRFLMEISGPPA